MDYEKMGAFYVGKKYDLETTELQDDVVLYDSKDLTTHAVIIGMTGSGKTGLGIGLLEESLMDNIPLIAIDPKGDLGNLLLTFPDLTPENFRPWINEQEASNQGQTPDEFAASQAALWEKGLGQWGQTAERIRTLRSKVDMAVYTPGSSAGLPVSVLRSFNAPSDAVRSDTDLYRERIQTTATSLLALMGEEADPVTSREHILISNILEKTWAEGKNLDIAGLIRAIQQPPFERIGVMELDMFYPAKDRFGLAMKLNNLLAAPGFEAWLEGEPLDIQRMLFTAEGKARASIFTISHLSDSERMFFVSMLLNEMLAWMRTQGGTSSLRAMLYMDEIFGYLPPSANPPSKTPMLTLLKQARAFGLGLVLSTQNPVDLDYKALSNCGTWFIGRLQTERDKERVLEGLLSASPESLDKAEMQNVLSSLGKRSFLLHNINEDAPVIFQTRWVMSYLSGPMTREQIKRLMADRKTLATVQTPALKASAPQVSKKAEAPVMPQDVPVYYVPVSGAGTNIIYYPAVAGFTEVHYSSVTHGVNETKQLVLAVEMEDGPVPVDWDNAEQLALAATDLESKAMTDAEFADLPKEAMKAKAYAKWQKDLFKHIRQDRPLKLFKSKDPKLTSDVTETQADFRARIAQQFRENRDVDINKLRQKYGDKLEKLQERLRKAEQTIEKEADQVKRQQMDTLVNVGTTLLSAFMGRKTVSVTNMRRASSSVRSAGRLQEQQQDVNRAKENAASIVEEMHELESELQKELDALTNPVNPSELELEEVFVKANSTDVTLDVFALIWLPYRRDAKGVISPDFDLKD